jgi:uncharacterized protein YcbX
MRLAAIRRYPVKAMAGEALEVVDLDRRGLVGDRWFAVRDAEGHFASFKDTSRFRRRDAVGDFAAATTVSGIEVARGGASWVVGEQSLDQELSMACGVDVRVLPEESVSHQDAGQVSVVGTASLQWCREHLDSDGDPRRLRVNLVVETDEPFVEETWLGREVAIGGVRLRGVERIDRCRTVDLAQDGVLRTERLLKALGGSRELCLGVYADVVAPGTIRVGDAVATV